MTEPMVEHLTHPETPLKPRSLRFGLDVVLAFGPALRVCRAWGAALLLLAFAASAQAQGYGALAAHLKVTRIEHHEEIAADYTSTLVVHMERQALSDQGAIEVGKFAVSYNPDLESVDIEEAYTEKADGQKIPVTTAQIQLQKGFLAPGLNISWPGLNTLQVTFAQVQKGDKTFVRYRKRIHQAALPQWLSYLEYLHNALDYDSYKVVLTAPANMPLQVHSQGLQQSRSIEGSGEAARQRWQLQGSSRNFSDAPGVANALKVLPYWMYSTLPSRTALADAFGLAMREKMRITPEVQALSNKIIGQAKAQTEREKVQAIAHWISQEMRYVAVFIGTGGYVPHDLAEILKNRYGDCKDHTLLMMSLLKAAGIESAPALINTVHADLTLPVAGPVYNHVIVYIPSLNLFTDPTAAHIALGQLPWADSAKPVVVNLAGGSQDMRTPAFSVNSNRVHLRSVWRLDDKGNAQADIQLSTWGQAASEMQEQLQQIPAGFSGAAVQRFLQAAGLKGKGFLQYPAVQKQVQEQSLSAQIELPKFVVTPEAASINPHPQISSVPAYVLNNLGPAIEKDRRFDMLCTPISVTEEFELHLPNNAQVLSLPPGLERQQAGLIYRSSYQQSGNTIKGQRHFERHPTLADSGAGAAPFPSHICTLQDLQQRQETLEEVRKNLRSTVLYKLP